MDGPEIVDGLPVRRVGKGSRRGGGGPKPPRPATLERPVVNCLACGKVYDCRGTFTSDITAFVGESSPNSAVHSGQRGLVDFDHMQNHVITCHFSLS